MNFRLITVLAGVALLSAPKITQAQETKPSIAGMYRLVTVDGRAVPCRPVHPEMPANAGPGPEVLAATFLLRPNGSLVLAMSYRMTRDTMQTYTAMPFTGTWKAVGDGYVAGWDGAGTTPLRVSGDTLVMNNEGMMFAYVKGRR